MVGQAAIGSRPLPGPQSLGAPPPVPLAPPPVPPAPPPRPPVPLAPALPAPAVPAMLPPVPAPPTLVPPRPPAPAAPTSPRPAAPGPIDPPAPPVPDVPVAPPHPPANALAIATTVPLTFMRVTPALPWRSIVTPTRQSRKGRHERAIDASLSTDTLLPCSWRCDAAGFFLRAP